MQCFFSDFNHFTSLINGQTIDWETSMLKNIYGYNTYNNRVVVIYGDSNGTKVVKSKRYFPGIAGLDKFTGEKLWEIKDPMSMMGASKAEKNHKSVTVKLKHVNNTNLIRVGRMLILDENGKVLFNPTKAGLTHILYSKVFPEGILANATLKGENVLLFLSFDTWKIEWTKTKSDKTNKTHKKLNSFMIKMMSNAPNGKVQLEQTLANSPLYNGYYTVNGNYIFQDKEKGEIISIHLKTGKENWKFTSKIVLSNYLIAKNKNTGDLMIYLVDKTSRFGNKHQILALDGRSGKVLWKKEKGYTEVYSLSVIDDLATVLVLSSPKKIGKKYFQIFDSKGTAKLENNTLRSYETELVSTTLDHNLLTIVTKSSQVHNSSTLTIDSIDFEVGEATIPEYVNIIDLETGKYLLKKRIKTAHNILFTKIYNNSRFLVIQPDRVQLFDIKTRKEIGRSIKSKTEIVYLENNEGTVYIASDKAGKLYTIDTNGEIKGRSLKKMGSKIKQVHEIISLENGSVLLQGILNKTKLVSTKKQFKIILTKIGTNGTLEYEHTYKTPNYIKSWRMPIIDDNIYIYTFDKAGTHSVGVVNMESGVTEKYFSYAIENNKRDNDGSYYFSKKDRVIYHTPIARSTSPLDKKSQHFNAKGILKVRSL